MARRATIYYNGGAPIYSREIGRYQRCPGAEALAWMDPATGR